jgi:hypothetical protein
MSTSAELAANRQVLRETALDKLTSRNVVNLPRTIVAGSTASSVSLTAADSGRDILVNCAALAGGADLTLLLPVPGAGNRGQVYRIFYQVAGTATHDLVIDTGLAGRMRGGIYDNVAVEPVLAADRFIRFVGGTALVGAMVEISGNGGAAWSVSGQSSAAGGITSAP